MNRRASLQLMELLVMVLVFALAAAACLGCFVGAWNLQRDTARMGEAVILAQNTAELLKAGADPMIQDTQGFELEIDDLPSEVPGLKAARVRVLWEDTALVQLEVGWQEVRP